MNLEKLKKLFSFGFMKQLTTPSASMMLLKSLARKPASWVSLLAVVKIDVIGVELHVKLLGFRVL